MDTTFKITKITVIVTDGTDKISLYLDAPSAFPEMGYPACANVEARHGYGVEWCRKTLGRDPDEVIETRRKEKPFPEGPKDKPKKKAAKAAT